MIEYVHGYAPNEAQRLTHQADALTELLHHDTWYPPGSHVLEAGCGVGAQTAILARRSPHAQFTAVEISATSLKQAEARAAAMHIKNVQFIHRDILELTSEDRQFDHIFVCFVLEHLPRPLTALRHLRTLLKPGGTITVIEGDHGSFYCHPYSSDARRVVQCLVDIQTVAKGNALIGRQLYPLLTASGFMPVTVSPRMMYVDGSTPKLIEAFSKRTFIAMVEAVKDEALQLGLTDDVTWQNGIADLYRATEVDGVFCYTFFKATATNAE